MGGSGVRLSASQVIERPPAEVFRFVATDHFQNHPQVGSGGYRHHQDLPPGRWGSERPRAGRTDQGRQVEGTMEVTEYEPARRFTEVSRFGPFVALGRDWAPVAPARHPAGW